MLVYLRSRFEETVGMFSASHIIYYMRTRVRQQ